MRAPSEALHLRSFGHEVGHTVAGAKKIVREHPVKTAVIGGLTAAAIGAVTILYARGSASPVVAEGPSSRVGISEPANLPPPPAFIAERPAIGAGTGGGGGGGGGGEPPVLPPQRPNPDQPGVQPLEGGEGESPQPVVDNPAIAGGEEQLAAKVPAAPASQAESATVPPVVVFQQPAVVEEAPSPQVTQPPSREGSPPSYIPDVKTYRGESVSDEVLEKTRNWFQQVVVNMEKSGQPQLVEMADYIRKANRPRPGRPVEQQLDLFVSPKKGMKVPAKETIISSTRGGMPSQRPALELYPDVLQQWDPNNPRVMSDVWYRVAWLREFFEIAAGRELSPEQILGLYKNAGSDGEIAQMDSRLLAEGRNIGGGLGGSQPTREISPSPDASQSGYLTEWPADWWAAKMVAEGKFRVDAGSPPNDNRPRVNYWGGKLVGVSDLEKGLSVEILFPNGEIKKFFFLPPKVDASWSAWLRNNGARVIEEKGTATSLLVGNCGDNGCRWVGSLKEPELRRMPAGVIVGASVLTKHDEGNNIAGSGPDVMSFSFYTR